VIAEGLTNSEVAQMRSRVPALPACRTMQVNFGRNEFGVGAVISLHSGNPTEGLERRVDFS
jgi:hypothetical protein